MTPEQLQAIRERCEAATPGPWKWETYIPDDQEDEETLFAPDPDIPGRLNGVITLHPEFYRRDEDLDFIACAREDVPKLLAEVDEVERLRGENQRLREALDVREEVQWFAKQMEKKLKENDHKPHWSQSDLQYLCERLREEFSEVENELWWFCERPNVYRAKEVIKECADVANFAMMIADNVRRELETQKD